MHSPPRRDELASNEIILLSSSPYKDVSNVLTTDRATFNYL